MHQGMHVGNRLAHSVAGSRNAVKSSWTMMTMGMIIYIDYCVRSENICEELKVFKKLHSLRENLLLIIGDPPFSHNVCVSEQCVQGSLLFQKELNHDAGEC